MSRIRSLILYTFSTGLNRGAALLYLPILGGLLSLEDFGLFSLVQATITFLIPVLTLGGSAAIMREGAESIESSLNYLREFSKTALIMGVPVIAVFLIFDTSYANWITFTLILSLSESLQLLFLTYLRAKGADIKYFVYITSKVSGFLIIVLLIDQIDLFTVFLYQSAWNFFLVLLTSFVILIKGKNLFGLDIESIKKVAVYSLPMIPHGLFQWSLGNSPRYAVKYIEGETALGVFSVASSLAMLIMLLNAGISLTLPQTIFNNYDKWLKSDIRKKSLWLYGLVVILASGALFTYLKLDPLYWNLIKVIPEDTFLYVGILSTGIYLLGVYYFYGNYILYHKKTAILAKQTVITSIISIVVSIVMIYFFGILGACIGSLITYLVYTSMVIYSACKIEPIIKKTVKIELSMVPIVCAILILAGIYLN